MMNPWDRLQAALSRMNRREGRTWTVHGYGAGKVLLLSGGEKRWGIWRVTNPRSKPVWNFESPRPYRIQRVSTRWERKERRIRMVFALRKEGLVYREIAQRVGITPARVGQILSKEEDPYRIP